MAKGDTQLLRIPAPGGMASLPSPRVANAAVARVLENFIPGPGYVTLRNGVSKAIVAATTGTTQYAAGYMTLNDKLLLSKIAGGFDTWAMKFNAPVSQSQWSTGFSLWAASVEIGSYAYGLNVPAGNMLRWDGTLGGGLVALANAPTGLLPGIVIGNTAVHGSIANHIGRLWVGTGIPPGGGSYSATTLYWTDVGGTPTDNINEWKDDVSGLVNQIVLDQESSNPIMALGRVGPYLGIIRRNSLWLLTGSDSSSWAVKQRVAGVGHHPKQGGVLEFGDTIIFNSDRGLLRWDGATMDDLSASIESEWRGTMGGCRLAVLDDEWIMATPSSANTSFLWLCYVPTKAWLRVKFDPSLIAASGGVYQPVVGNRASGAPFIGDGLDTVLDLGGSSGLGIHRESSVAVAGYDSNPPATPVVAPAYYITQLQELASPSQKAAIRRVMIDYGGRFVDANQSATLIVRAGDGTQLGSFALPDTGNAPTMPISTMQATRWSRATFDLFVETPDLFCEVIWTDFASPRSASANLYIGDIWVEYQTAEQVRS